MLRYLCVLVIFLTVCQCSLSWPASYNFHRPNVNSLCKADSANFCKDGLKNGDFPIWWGDDTINIYALRMRQQNILAGTVISTAMDVYALGLESKNTKKNYTLSWDALSGYYDTAVPKILPNKSMVWCNQAAACLKTRFIGPPLQDIIHIGSISAEHIAAFEVWLKHLNLTAPSQEVLLVHNSTFAFVPSFDSTSVFMQSIHMLKSIGATFKNISLNMNVYGIAVSQPPTKLGNEVLIRKGNPRKWEDIVHHYGLLQMSTGVFDFIKKEVELYLEMHHRNEFYYYFNQEYWQLRVKSPYLSVIDFKFPLP